MCIHIYINMGMDLEFVFGPRDLIGKIHDDYINGNYDNNDDNYRVKVDGSRNCLWIDGRNSYLCNLCNIVMDRTRILAEIENATVACKETNNIKEKQIYYGALCLLYFFVEKMDGDEDDNVVYLEYL